MLDDARQERALLWHDDDLEGLEILHASYLTHSFARHTHDTFAIGLIEAGAGAFDSRGTTHIARASTIFVIHPDEVHNGYAAAPSGWTYRMLYPDPALFEHFGLEAPRGSHALPFFPHTIHEIGGMTIQASMTHQASLDEERIAHARFSSPHL